MRLTRRDALAALAAVGVAGGVGAARVVDRYDPPQAAPALVPTLVAAAEVVYPSTLEGVPEFVETYVRGRLDDERRRDGVVAALTDLDEIAREWEGASFAALAADERDALLRELGVDVADPDPEGTLPNRLRYYVVNDLLYALYASPTGGRLVGIENPVGYPGGVRSYRRAKMPDEGGDDA